MNIKEEIMKWPTVVRVVIDKDFTYHGQPATAYNIFARHPVTGKLYEHTISFTDKLPVNKENGLSIIKSMFKDWYKDESL